MNNSRVITDAKWFNGVGIVRVNDRYGCVKYYIKGMDGMGMHTTEEEDAEYIADWGSTFPNDAGDVLFGYK